MTDQETANVATIAVRARSPDTARGPEYGRNVEIHPSRSDHDLVFHDIGKAALHAHNGAPKSKKNVLKGSLTISSVKPEAPHDNTTHNDDVDDLTDIFISDEVLKQLRSHSDNKDKKSIKQRRKIAKLQNKTVRLTPANYLESDAMVKGPAKKILKPMLRRKGSMSNGRSQVLERTGSMEVRGSSRRDARNKVESNNWMVNDAISTDAQTRLAPVNIFAKSPSSYVDSMVQESESVCRVCSMRNCTPGSCTGGKAIAETASKEYSFKRADSSDDSGCFSNQSLQSINSPGSQNNDANIDPFPVNEETAVQPDDTSTNAKRRSYSSGLCSACGNEPQGNGSGLCKTCIGRIKQDGIRIGALGELRAYAQSIADSVKKILSISPRENEEVAEQFSVNDGRQNNRTGISKRENTNITNIPGGCLQKCKTQISMTVGEDLRPKNILNKSISFDGRAAALVDENSRGSPVYWITHDKCKLPLPASTFCESEEDKLLRCLENGSDHSVLEGDYFSPSAKELKHYTVNEDDKNAKTDKVDKSNKRNLTKQLSCVERIKTEGNIRGNSFQQDKKNESKRLYDLQRSRSRISRSVNVDTDNYEKHPQKREEDIKALNVFRLKVIHEGSPVDPLDTVQKVKGSEDSKDRRAALMRSATAPNKNHMPKKDNTADDKSAMIKAKRSSTKVGIKTSRSPMFVNEESSIDTEEATKQILYEPLPESWRDDSSVIAVTPFIRRRSTSYDGSKPILSKRSELHKSISRSAIERDAAGNKQRRKTLSKVRTSPKHNGYSSKIWQPLRFAGAWTDENHPDVTLPVATSISREPYTDTNRYHNMDSLNKEFLPLDSNDRIARVPSADANMELSESPNKSAYFDDVSYYEQPIETILSLPSKELVYIGDRNTFGTDNYYCEADETSIDDGIEADKMVDYDAADVNSIFKGDEGDDDTYHNQIEQYNINDVSPEKDSLWYSSHLDRRALMTRDGSHESKSSTSFHIVMNVKSSHSDVALMKYQGAWEHPNSRRQSMYSETDVDTGLIYHFAKRQTTRAHVPAYHDLTSASKDIYTMSGDVSTSASSNSGISTKSEVSDCVYTGGFYKHDPFYENDSKVSSSNSSADSSGHLYFEPNGGTKREPSELDIYTGAIFSSSQNALSLGRATEINTSKQPKETLHDGSTNNSTRPVGSRMTRRLRYRPHIDVIKFKSTDSVNEFISKCMEPNSDLILCNISNNSCTWCSIDEAEDSGSQGALVSVSRDPMYTDYAPGTKPVFHTHIVDTSPPVVDLLKYEKQDSPGNSLFFTTPTDENNADSDWYSGFTKHRKTESASNNAATKAQCFIQCTYPWQHHDDYYTSAQRPKLDKSNSNKHNLPEVASNTNNNRLDDIYTGFFESPKVRSSPEQQHRSRKTSSDSWYAEQPRRSHSGFYGDRQATPESAGRAFASDYETTEGAYSSPSVFAQAREAYAGASTYMASTGWKEHDRNHSSPNGNYVDEEDDDESPRPRPLTPGGYSSGDKYNYFPYGSDPNPADGSYLYDSENYCFDRRSPSPESSSSHEIKKVGGIVCRENVANKEDYAEDVNRDLEPAVWASYNFRHEEKIRHSDEPSSSRSEPVSESYKAPPVSVAEKYTKHYDDSIYNQNRLYDSGGDRKKWRENSTPIKSVPAIKKEPSPHRANNAGDAKKPEYAKSTAWNPPDQIPDKARGKRNLSSTPKPPISDGSKSGSTTSHVISSVTSLPSRFTNYVKKWL